MTRSTATEPSLDAFLKSIGDAVFSVLLLDADGNLMSFEDQPNADTVCKLVVNWKSIRLSDYIQSEKLRMLVKACIAVDWSAPKALPPPIKMKTVRGRCVYIDAIPIPSHYKHRFGGATAVLYIREVSDPSAVTRKLLERKYNLTQAETAVALAVRNGSKVKDVARIHNVSIWTVRSQLRSVFQKTNTHRQAELVAVLSEIDATEH